MAESKLTLTTFPWDLGGDGVVKTGETILQDAGRAAVMTFLTVMAKKQSDGKLIPLTDVNPALTSASMTCGTSGAVATYQFADCEFAINIDGNLTDVIGIDMTAITALTDVAGAINAIAIPLGVICTFNEETVAFTFTSLKKGLPASSITVLTAVVAGAGTDISTALILNGLTGVGTVTAATGEVTAGIPAGILMVDEDITAAALVAGDVTNQHLLIGGNKYIDEDLIILENSLTLASIVTATGKTVRQHLEDLDIFPTPSDNNQQIQPI